MNSHLNDEQLIGFVHHTLTDAQRETMDAHLLACPGCRARLTDHEALQRRVRYSLSASIKAVSPSSAMTFAAVAPHLKRWSSLSRLWQPLFFGATLIAASAGLALSLIGLPKAIEALASGSTLTRGPLPALACACFGFTVWGNYEWKPPVRPRLILSSVLAFILWVGTAFVGLQVIALSRGMLIWLVEYFSSNFSLGLALGNWALIPLGALWIALVIGGGEYHYKRVGQRSSWKVFGWTIAVEVLALLVLFI